MHNPNIKLLIADIRKSGGTERAVVNIANDLAEKGFNVNIISIFSEKGDSAYPLSKEVFINHLNVFFQTGIVKRVFIGFKELFDKLKVVYKDSANTIFMATDPFVSFVLARLHTQKSDNRIIVCEHMALSISKRYSVLFRQLFLQKVDSFVVLTKRDQLFLQKILPKMNCEVIPNRISFYPETLTDYSSKTILTIGRLENQKNYIELIQLVSPILKKYEDWHLIIVGEGSQKEQIEEKIKENEMSRHVSIAPPTKDIESYFRTCSIYAMSSIYEGFPMVLLEAKSFGLPIVAYDCPNGPAEMIQNDKDGFLVNMHDQDDFRKRLESLMLNSSMRSDFGKIGSEDVQSRFSKKAVVAKWLELINNLS